MRTCPLTGADRKLRVALSPDPGVKERIALQTLRAAVTALGGSVTAVSEPGAARVVLVLLGADGAAAAGAPLDAEDLATFAQPNGVEQGYVIRPAAGASAPLYLAARDPQGLLYAAVTLAQLLRLEGGRIVARAPHVRDWPSFRYRGNNWLLWVECGRWSYERGDGATAYAARIERKLDFSLQHKVNLLIFDGFGWNPERFPGYGALARRCARYARERGIKLLVGGYGAGYGAGDRYDGHIFRNRRGYPDGELYDCYRFVGRDRSSTFGTCLSNAALTALKQEELSWYVRAGEPGALYIHFLDIEDMAGHELSWRTRCPACRERWPNDALAAADGAAGAFAQLYDALCDAVFSVSNRETGYHAARDCMPILISPAYTVRTDSDATWQAALHYWAAVSRSMRNVENVQFGLREQYLSEDGSTHRLQELRRVLDAEGRGHGTCAVVFAGADGFDNDHLYSGNPVLSKYYLGVDTLMNASGHAYQEPLQVLNAEYGWRASDNPWFDEPVAASNAVAIRRFDEYLCGLRRPAGIFGPEGFLEAACRRLYGPAGGHAHGRGVASHHPGRRAAGGVPVPHRVPAHRRPVGPRPSCGARPPMERPLAAHRLRHRDGCDRDPSGGGAGGRDRPGARRPGMDGGHLAGRPRRSRDHDPLLRPLRRGPGSVRRRHHDHARRPGTAGHRDRPPDRPAGDLPAAQLLTGDARPSGRRPGPLARLRGDAAQAHRGGGRRLPRRPPRRARASLLVVT